MSPASPPQQLQGRYELIEPVGEGGVGQVWRAIQQPLGRPVAVKLIKADRATSEKVRRRFRDEARTHAAMNHPGIAQVHDFGVTDDGAAWLVMELAPGQPLNKALGVHPPLPQLLRVADDILAALDHAHGHGVVHRDLKPANIIYTGGQGGPSLIKLVDFGIAFVADPGISIGSEPREKPALPPGLTPAFAPPELCAGQADAGPEVDLYALGVMLYALLNGRLPFWDRDPRKLADQKLREPPPECRPDPQHGYPVALCALIDALLAQDPRRRPRSASLLRLRLRGIARAAGCGGALEPLSDPASGLLQALRAADPGLAMAEEDGLVGRVPERQKLMKLLAGTQAERSPTLLWMTGARGVGVSSMARWLATVAAEVGWQVGYGCHVHGPGERVFNDALEDLLGSAELGGEALVDRLAAVVRKPGLARPLSRMLRPASGDQTHGRPPLLRQLLRACLKAADGSDNPTMLVLDEAHNAGPWLIAEVEALWQTLGAEELPLLIVLVGEDEAVPPAEATEFELGRLPLTELADRIRERFGFSPALARAVAGHAQGHPLHALRLSAELVRRQALEERNAGLSLKPGQVLDGCIDRELALELDSILAEVVRGLSEPGVGWELLLRLAALGHSAPWPLLQDAQLAERPWTEEQLRGALVELVQRRVLLLDRVGPMRVEFRQPATRDAILARLRPSRRRIWWGRAARALEALARSSGQLLSGVHLKRLAELRSALSAAAEAGRAWLAYARRARARQRLVEASDAFLESIHWLSRSAEEAEFQARVALEAVEVLTARRDGVMVDSLLELVTRLDSGPQGVEALLRLAVQMAGRGYRPQARALLSRARRAPKGLEHHCDLAEAEIRLASSDEPNALILAEQVATQAASPGLRARALAVMGRASRRQHQLERAVSFCQQAATQLGAQGALEWARLARVDLATSYSDAGANNRGRRLMEECLREAEVAGDRQAYHFARLWHAQELMQQGRLREASQLMENLLTGQHELGVLELGDVLNTLGEIYRRTRQWPLARLAYEGALTCYRRADNGQDQIYARTNLGLVELALRRPRAARTLFEQAAVDAEAWRARSLHRAILVFLARTRIQEGIERDDLIALTQRIWAIEAPFMRDVDVAQSLTMIGDRLNELGLSEWGWRARSEADGLWKLLGLSAG